MAALRDFMVERGPFVVNPSRAFQRRLELIMCTPALREYSRKLWIRCEQPLAGEIANELGLPPETMVAGPPRATSWRSPSSSATSPTRSQPYTQYSTYSNTA